MKARSLLVLPDKSRLVESAAELVARLAHEAIAGRGVFTVALAGGGTPRPVYERLAMIHDQVSKGGQGIIDWPRVHVFFGDERCVPPEDAASNYRMAKETLLDRVPIPAENVHRIRGEIDPAVAAAEAEQDVRRVLGSGGVPSLDLVMLGLGDDGHTASLFPGTAALREATRLVVPQYVDKLAAWRVTFTAPLVNAARNVLFLVEGAGKAATLAAVLEGPWQPDVLPSQLVRPSDGVVHWMVDAAAAARLSGKTDA